MPNELWLDDVIGEGFFTEGVTVKRVRSDLEKLDRKQRLRVRIDSPGGDVFVAVAIRSLLSEWEAGYDTHVDGLAASAATFFFPKSAKVTMARGSRIMIHNPWWIVAGEADDMRRAAGVLDGITDDLVRDYREKSGKPDKEIREAMSAETWLTVEQAITFGLADEAAGEEAKAFSVPEEFGYKNIPEGVGIAGKIGVPLNAGRDGLSPLRNPTSIAAMRRRIDLAKARALA